MAKKPDPWETIHYLMLRLENMVTKRAPIELLENETRILLTYLKSLKKK